MIHVVKYEKDGISESGLIRLQQLVKLGGHNPNFIDEVTHLYIACFSCEIAGMAGLANYRGHWYFRGCVVDPKYRGIGIQRKLIECRLNELQTKRINNVSVWVEPTNCYSLNNLVDAGFRFTADKPKMFKDKKHIKLTYTDIMIKRGSKVEY